MVRRQVVFAINRTLELGLERSSFVGFRRLNLERILVNKVIKYDKFGTKSILNEMQRKNTIYQVVLGYGDFRQILWLSASPHS